MEGCRDNNNNNNNNNGKLGPWPLRLSSLSCPLPSPSLCGLWCNGYPAVVSESSRCSEDQVLLSRQNGGRRAVPRCHVDGCRSDLSSAREYQRRHKVCELHSKATTVRIAGIDQRFCQQCSRFHALSEFDDTKRSCRKRLARHNERRRKSLNTASSSSSSSSSSSTAAAAAAAMARDGYYNLQRALSMSPVHFLHGHGHRHGQDLLLKGKGLTEQYQHHHHHHHDHHDHDDDDDHHHISNMIGRALSLLSSDADTWHSYMKKENDDLLAQMLGRAHHPTHTRTHTHP